MSTVQLSCTGSNFTCQQDCLSGVVSVCYKEVDNKPEACEMLLLQKSAWN